MIQSAASVGGFPVFRAVAPPCVEGLWLWDEVAHDVVPISGVLQITEMLDFNGGVGDNF